ncbi:sensor domain-containing protein [Mycolicibacterium sp.]|uniref:sensor domain-containing protein n=1 Tax=Mycolicibacterium sp. TaxID=2320850 RepID=UPI0025FF1246|nr:sensor domain-containing protein [Mycolicibacterium sp.]
MDTRGVSLVLVLLLLAGCTRTVDDARPLRERSVAPIAASQIEDLLSKSAQGGEDAGTSLFATVTPDACAGVVEEVRAPFVFDAEPVAHTGGYTYDDTVEPPGNIVEIVGVYHSDFDPGAAIEMAEHTIEACSDDKLTATTSGGDKSEYGVRPRSDSGSAQIVLWSLTDLSGWACDNAFVAAHNAAIEITVCGEGNGYDVLTLARDALKRIETLANATT